MLTSQFGHTDIAKELLERGANPNIQDKVCMTIFYASIYTPGQ